MNPTTDAPEGYKCLSGISPAEDHIGPFYYRKTEEGLLLGFEAQDHNCNGIGTVHGGVLMAFADYVATMVALSGVSENCATISFTSDFVGAARLGDWVEGRAEVIRRTGSMTFLRGQLSARGEPVLNFQGVLRRLKKPGE
jgi:uncharacterized protein (TIGR00369 family)